MDSVETWNKKILDITILINEKHPELSKYLEEMPITIPDESNPEINIKGLRDYYNSLNSLLNRYVESENIKK